jgi:HAD superfamily hydrolase (TIGR01509 family)
MSRQLKYILLDCDGVILNSELLSRDAELEVLADFGLTLSARQYDEITLGLSETWHLKLISKELDKIGVGISLDHLETKLRDARWSRYETGLRIVPGMDTVIDQYKCRLAVVSSSDRRSVRRKLKLAGASGVPPERIFTGDQTTNSKTETYELALTKLEASSNECLAIEDSRPGVLAARSANIEVWGFTGTSTQAAALEGELFASGASKAFNSVAALHRAVDQAFTRGLAA